jgi:EAL and modified HD-GYP domain-containing signal transduction protein
MVERDGSGEIFLGRQPIFDRRNAVFAYELLFRGSVANEAAVDDESRSTPRVIVNTLSSVGLDRILCGKPGFVNVGEEFLMGDLLFLLSSDRFVLEILETVPVTGPVIARCRELKARGYRIALDDFGGEEEWGALLDIADFVKVDFRKVGVEALGAFSRTLMGRKIPLVAEKVESPEEQARAMDLGYAFFQGFFFARPEVLRSRKKDPGYSVLARILSLVLADADLDDIHGAVRPHIDLSLSLIKVANVVGRSPLRPITTLRQAILSLGRNPLRRWFEILLFTTGLSEHRYGASVLHLALARARLMETLSELWMDRDSPSPDQAFMAGLLSLSESLLGRTFEDLLSDVPSMDSLRGAMTEGAGPIGLLLDLAQRLEGLETEEVSRLLSDLPVPADQVASARTQSILWADDIVRIFA